MTLNSKLQREYDEFCRNLTCAEYDELCGNFHVFEFEKFIINEIIKAKRVLDIGCGTGHRIFDYLLNQNIQFKGIEKFINLSKCSRYKNYIINADLANSSFLDEVEKKLHGFEYDAVFCLGGVVNGLLDQKVMKNGWKNLLSLSKKNCPLFISFLSHRDIFHNNHGGKPYQLNINFPYQYFYSRFDILNIIKSNAIGNIKYLFEDNTLKEFTMVYLVIDN